MNRFLIAILLGTLLSLPSALLAGEMLAVGTSPIHIAMAANKDKDNDTSTGKKIEKDMTRASKRAEKDLKKTGKKVDKDMTRASKRAEKDIKKADKKTRSFFEKLFGSDNKKKSKKD